MSAVALTPFPDFRAPAVIDWSGDPPGFDADATDVPQTATPGVVALREARHAYAAWFRGCLQVDRSRRLPPAPPPETAVALQLDRIIAETPPASATLRPLLQAQRDRLQQLSSLVSALAANRGADEAAATWDRLIDIGMEALEGFADAEVAVAAEDAARDPLTGLGGRAALQQRLEAEQALLQRHGRICAVAMVDLDHFKRINDRHGHLAGDRVLGAFAQTLCRNLRPYDGVYRYGGEEFVVCLPGATAAQAAIVLDRVRRRMARMPLVRIREGGLRVHFSAGVAALSPRGVAHALDCADGALYQAKALGRDRVETGRCVGG